MSLLDTAANALVGRATKAFGDRAQPLLAATGLVLLTYLAVTTTRSLLRTTTTPVWRKRAPFPAPLPPGVAAVYFQSKTVGGARAAPRSGARGRVGRCVRERRGGSRSHALTPSRTNQTGLLIKWRAMSPKGPARGCVFLHHGGGGCADTCVIIGEAELYLSLGLVVYMMDAPGQVRVDTGAQ